MRYQVFTTETALFIGLFCFQSCDELDELWNGKENEEIEIPKEDTSIDLQKGLKAYYTFNDGSCNDISGNGFHGVFQGNPIVTEDTPTGKGYAIFLNGYKEHLINIPYNPLHGFTQATYSFWIKDLDSGIIIGAIDTNGASTPFVSCTQNEFIALNNHSFSKMVQNIKEFWSMRTITLDEQEQKFYINGELYDVQTQNINPSSGEKIQIGGNGNNSYRYWQKMKIDNVRIYSRALNAYEVNKIYVMESK